MPLTISGGHSGGGTPLPIPNRAVKPASADGTRRATSRESRTPPDYFQKGRRKRPFVVLGRPQLLAPVRVEIAQPADALADRRMRHEQLRQAFFRERVDRVQRLGGRAGCKRDELARLLEPNERIGEPVR